MLLQQNHLNLLFIFTISSALLFGCASDSKQQNASKPTDVSPATELKTPTKEILVFEGDSSRSYIPLGSIEYKVEGIGYGNTFDVPMEAQKQLKDGLKKVAYTKYGDKVDAIINVKMGKQIAGGYGGALIASFGAKNTMASAEGIAVSYNPSEVKASEKEPVVSPNKKRKAK